MTFLIPFCVPAGTCRADGAAIRINSTGYRLYTKGTARTAKRPDCAPMHPPLPSDHCVYSIQSTTIRGYCPHMTLAMPNFWAAAKSIPKVLTLGWAFTLLAACQTTHPDWGRGPVTLSPSTQLLLNRYMATESASAFAISTDGRNGFFVYCPGHHGLDCVDTYDGALSGCRRAVKGRIECKILADLREIVWQGPVMTPSNSTMRQLQNLENAVYCFDSNSKTYYIVGSRCMLEDEQVTPDAYAAGVSKSATVYCRKNAVATQSRYYTAKGACDPIDREVSKALFEMSKTFCRSAGGDYYRANGKCEDGGTEVGEAEFKRKAAERVR